MSMMTSSFTNGRTTAPSVVDEVVRLWPLPWLPCPFLGLPVISSLVVDCHVVPAPISTPGLLWLPVPLLLFCP